MMLGLSVADPLPSSSWDVPDAEVSDAEISDPELPARSKAAEHAKITRSALLAKDSQPLLIGAAPTLPESLSNPMFCILFKGSPLPGRAISVRSATRNVGKKPVLNEARAFSLARPRP